MIDRFCARVGSSDLHRYCTYCRQVCEEENINTLESVSCKFEISRTDSTGHATVEIPMKKTILQLKIDIIEKNILLLLSLADMHRLGMFYKNRCKRLVLGEVGETTKLEEF